MHSVTRIGMWRVYAHRVTEREGKVESLCTQCNTKREEGGEFMHTG